MWITSNPKPSPPSPNLLRYNQSSASMEIRKRATMAEEETAMADWNDLITEILLRLPAESVARFKFVCKNWYNLIRSPYFISLYGSRNLKPTKKKVSLYRRSCDPLPCGTRTKVSFRFYDKIVNLTLPIVAKNVEIVGCSNGVVCLALSLMQDEFLLWNPTSNELKRVRKLLNGRVLRWPDCGFWFNHADNSFKVARVEFGSNTRQGNVAAQVRIFSSVGDSWRLKEFVLNDFRICNCIMFHSEKTQVTCVKRCMYWLTGRFEGVVDGTNLDHTCIICFDMVEEVFKRVALPNYSPLHLAQLTCYKEESLAMFVMRKDGRTVYFDMWVLNDCDGRNQAWTIQQTFRDLHWPIGFYGEDESNWKLLHFIGGERPHQLHDEETGKNEAFFASEGPEKLLAYHETLAPVN